LRKFPGLYQHGSGNNGNVPERVIRLKADSSTATSYPERLARIVDSRIGLARAIVIEV